MPVVCQRIRIYIYIWMSGEVGDERRFLHIFKERLKDCFYQRWWTHISNNERFDLYHCFKSTLQCERYLGFMQSRIYKTALAPFRLGVSRINCHRLQDPNTKRLKRTLIYFNRDTQYAHLRRNHFYQAIQRHLNNR